MEGAYAALYGRDFDTRLAPSVRVRYQRTTLVARRGGERITVDREVAFEGAGGLIAIDGRVDNDLERAVAFTDRDAQGIVACPQSDRCAGKGPSTSIDDSA